MFSGFDSIFGRSQKILNKTTVDVIGVRKWSFAPVAWFVLISGILLFLIGLKYGWLELTAAGVCALTVIAFAAFMTFGKSQYMVDLVLGESQVQVGQRAFGQITVENAGRKRLWPSVIELPVGKATAQFQLPFLGPHNTHEDLFAVPTHKRAVITVGPVKSVRSDPLGLARREVTWTDEELLFVHPQTIALQGAAAGTIRDLEGQTLRTVSDLDMNFHALREYVAGDDRRAIHWKSSARMQSLMVRQFEDTRRTHTAMILDNDPTVWGSDEAFELGVSTFASIGVNTITSEMERTFLVGSQLLRAETPKIFLNETSGIELALSAAPHSAMEQVARDAAQCSLAIVVTGGNVSQAALRAQSAVIGSGVRVLFIQCVPGAVTDTSTFVQSSFSRLGDLAQLPKLLRLAVTQ